MINTVDPQEIVIVFVDDGFSNVTSFAEALTRAGFALEIIDAGIRTAAEIEDRAPDIILLNDALALFDPYELCAALKTHEELQHVPVILVGAGDSASRVRALNYGAADYFNFPYDLDEVAARLAYHGTQNRQLRRLRDARLRERAYFEKISRMRDDMMQTASHDLKNPMTAIKLSVSILQRYLDQADPKIERHLSRIGKGVDRIHHLINSMFDLTLLREDMPMEYRPVTVSKFLDDYAGPFVGIAQQQGLTLTISPPEEDSRAMLDSGQLGRALQNLISNSLSYTETGGQIVAEARCDGDVLKLCVRDTGIGIPARDVDRVFDILFRVDDMSHNRQRGIGLGLAVVKAIVERHSGSVRLESAVGEGTVVTIEVPATAQPAYAAQATIHQTAF